MPPDDAESKTDERDKAKRYAVESRWKKRIKLQLSIQTQNVYKAP